jgi:predicted nucleotidyltransferase
VKRAEVVKLLKNLLKEKPEILLAFLFGSFAGNQQRPTSDVDIGILFETVPSPATIQDLNEKISTALKKEVDLLIINQASPILRMQILKKGKVIIKRNKKEFNRFYVQVVNQYDDLKQVRRKGEESILIGRIYG